MGKNHSLNPATNKWEPEEFGAKPSSLSKSMVLANDSEPVPVTSDFVSGVKKLLMDEPGGGITYIGKADPGTATSASSWQIQRITDAPFAKEWAGGDGNFDKIWNDRASLSYS